MGWMSRVKSIFPAAGAAAWANPGVALTSKAREASESDRVALNARDRTELAGGGVRSTMGVKETGEAMQTWVG
jgi:hypothetical protein